LLPEEETGICAVTFGFQGFLVVVSRGESGQEVFLALRYKNPVVIPIRNRKLATMLGSANGNLIKNLLWPNKPGRFSAGLAKNPPKDGPNIEPRLQTSGIIENALG